MRHPAVTLGQLQKWYATLVRPRQEKTSLRHRPLYLALTLLLVQDGPAATVHPEIRPCQWQEAQYDLPRDLVELDSYLSYRDLDTLESVVNRKAMEWQEKDRISFIAYMSKACSLLSSYDVGDISKRASLLSKYAIRVLTSGDLSLRDQVQFVEFLMFDPPAVDETSWRSLREQKAELWLAARRRVAKSLNPTFDFEDRPFLNVPTPAGSGAPAGSSPESIKDPKLRAEYKIAVAQNSAKARRYNDQYWLKRNAPHFYEETERYLVNAYSRPPADLAQLERLLSQYGDDNALRGRVLEQLRKRGLAGGYADFPIGAHGGDTGLRP